MNLNTIQQISDVDPHQLVADLDPGGQNDADLTGSGSGLLLVRTLDHFLPALPPSLEKQSACSKGSQEPELALGFFFFFLNL